MSTGENAKTGNDNQGSRKRGLVKQLSYNISMLSFDTNSRWQDKNNKGSETIKTSKTATTRTMPEDENMGLSGFRKLPSFYAFNRFGWVLVMVLY